MDWIILKHQKNNYFNFIHINNIIYITSNKIENLFKTLKIQKKV
jgi:hypothetical protein